MFDLNKYPMKNLQSIINVISDKENDGEEIDDPSDQNTQDLSSLSRAFPETPSNKDKGKRKDTEN